MFNFCVITLLASSMVCSLWGYPALGVILSGMALTSISIKDVIDKTFTKP